MPRTRGKRPPLLEGAFLACCLLHQAAGAAELPQPVCDLGPAFHEALETSRCLVLTIDSRWHWPSHQMREAWEQDPDLLARLQRDCVHARVDSDERPDVEARVARLFRLLRGRSPVLPLTVTLAPDGAIIDIAARMTPRSGPSSVGLLPLLDELPAIRHKTWKAVHAQDASLRQAVLNAPAIALDTDPGVPLDASLLRDFAGQLASGFEEATGGFGGAVEGKASGQVAMLFIAENPGLFETGRARKLLEQTMVAMEDGGTRDFLRGDTFRGSYDAHWRTVKFEKLLGPSAIQLQIDRLYAEMPSSTPGTRSDWFAEHDNKAELHREGKGWFAARPGFALDLPYGWADTWTTTTTKPVLTPEQFAALAYSTGATPVGNDAGVEGRNGFCRVRTDQEVRARFRRLSRDPAELRQKSRDILRQHRQYQPPEPVGHRPDWEALEMSARCRAPKGLPDAREWASHAMAVQGLVPHTPQCPDQVYLADQAFTIAALIDLFEVTSEKPFLDRAGDLARETLKAFDPGQGSPGLLDRLPRKGESDIEALPLIVYEDGDTPSAVAEMARNAARLARHTGEAPWFAASAKLLRPLHDVALRGGFIYANWGRALSAYLAARGEKP